MENEENTVKFVPSGVLQRFRDWKPGKRWLFGLSSLALLAGWYIAVLLFRPSEFNYLNLAASQYFEEMSSIGQTCHASYNDCSLSEAKDSDKAAGVFMYGLCRSESKEATYHYGIAMGPVGNYVYSDFEEVKR